ncbi:hypothetical protein 162322544 [Organic Lake phycodnavirus 1]|jgi:uncharacterized membrane protein|nr:hypothetical protein 162322544 [Organic Lake phycodnavirus 1]
MLLVKIASVSLLLDFIFLSFMKYYFNSMIQKIQGSPLKLNIFATAVVYFIIIFKIYYFIFLQNSSLLYAFLLGSTTYGIFEFTNMAIFKGWTYTSAIIDTLWGGILYFLTTYIVRHMI